ncbi:MAG TPA: hypothetical protein VGM60_14090 [Pseudonocardia sp.]|jgi:hypothetical protein|uniref:hypothetical protein n=1 Tax=Pseudonocardia sp. TaxID=60912 RepID=UPI002F41FB1C
MTSHTSRRRVRRLLTALVIAPAAAAAVGALSAGSALAAPNSTGGGPQGVGVGHPNNDKGNGPVGASLDGLDPGSLLLEP